ncbi:MAG: serine hydroxymethyltransferase [Chloroflexota bacterium]|nr:serine hydroxymethyltransferase [Chloroflexota bacterium]|tara:strand:+ start:319 stop:1548 length:1230 start_codon:yes stop_codon:yes gene_type:complete
MNDKEVKNLINLEEKSHKTSLNLIASENYPSNDVLNACGSIFSTKYAEGYPGARYYEGCEITDDIENLAIERAKKLFKCDHVNVQVHSGTQANQAVFLSVMKPEDNILSMKLDQGGHLSHGSKVNFSGKIYDCNFYGVDRETEIIDFDQVKKIAFEKKPKIIICGASAYSRTIDFEKFSDIANEVGAYLLSDVAHISGLIAANVHPSPVPHSDFVTTTTHKTLRGPRGAMIMCKKEFSNIIDKAVFPGMQGGPFVNMIAAKAIAYNEALGIEFKEYSKQVVKNAKKLSSVISSGGFRIVSGGTDNHQFTIDLSRNNLTGAEIATLLRSNGIIANKNGIPYDNHPPKITSGIRLGTPALTSRGMVEDQMEVLGNLIVNIINNKDDNNMLNKLSNDVKALASAFKLPGVDN